MRIPLPNLSGQSIGRYQIIEPLGEGGMAIVYKAFDTRLECDVAVKIIRTERFAPEMLKQALIRFEREAKAVAKLTHSNIVKVTDYGEHEGNPYLVMEYLPGGTLKDLIKHKGQIPWREAAQILIQVAEALGYAHSENIIHRDIKPSNILLTKNGIPMLTDFGVAKIIDEDSTQGLTGTYASIGTPEYMAPEQIGSKNVDARVDLYALGIVFYEMITGRRPFEADTPLAVMVKQTHDSLPRASYFVKEIPDVVEKFLSKSLSKDPKDRYQSAASFIDTLTMLLTINEGRGKIPTLFNKNKPIQLSHPESNDTKTVYQQKDEKVVRRILDGNYRFFRKKTLVIFLLLVGIGVVTYLLFPFPQLKAKTTPTVRITSTPSYVPPSPTSTQIPTISPSSSMTPTVTPNPTNTPTPDPNQVLLKPSTGSVDCYYGPNIQVYGKSGSISGEVIPIGLDKSKKWASVHNLQNPELVCWVLLNAFLVTGDINQLFTLPDPEIADPVLYYTYLQTSDRIWWSMPVGNFSSYACASAYAQGWLDYCKVNNVNQSDGRCGNSIWENGQQVKYSAFTSYVVNKYVLAIYSNSHFSKLSTGSCTYIP